MTLNITRRGVVPEPRYAQSLKKIIAKYPRAGEAVSGAEWSLARDPKGDGVHFGGNVWMAHLAKSPPMPAARIFYCFTKRILYMLEIELVDG